MKLNLITFYYCLGVVQMVSEQQVFNFNKIFKNYQLESNKNGYTLLNTSDLQHMAFVDVENTQLNDCNGFMIYIDSVLNDNVEEIFSLSNRQKQRICFNASNRKSIKNLSKKRNSISPSNILNMMFVYHSINENPISEIEMYELSEQYKNIIYVSVLNNTYMNDMYKLFGLGYCVSQRYNKMNRGLSKDIENELLCVIKKYLINLIGNISIFYNNDKYETNDIEIKEIVDDVLDVQFPYRIDEIICDDFAYKTLKRKDFIDYATKNILPTGRALKYDLYNLKNKNKHYIKLYNLIYFKMEHLYKNKKYFNLYEFLDTLAKLPYGIMYRNIECFLVTNVVLDFFNNYGYVISDKNLLMLTNENGIKYSLDMFTINLDSDRKNRNNNFPCWRATSEYLKVLNKLSNIFELKDINSISDFSLKASDKFRNYMYPFRFLEDYFLKNNQNEYANITKIIVEICSDCNENNILDNFFTLMRLIKDCDMSEYKKYINNQNMLSGMCYYIGCETQEFIKKSKYYEWSHYSIKTLWVKEYFKDVFYG